MIYLSKPALLDVATSDTNHSTLALLAAGLYQPDSLVPYVPPAGISNGTARRLT